jgi:hypothetical protein
MYGSPYQNTLDPVVNHNVVYGNTNLAVQQYLRVIGENIIPKGKQDNINQAIQALFEAGFTVGSPDGTHKLDSQKIYQALWRTASRMKPLDFQVHGSGRPQFVEDIATDGISTVMDRGGYAASLRDKMGGFFNLLMYGDGFIQVGASPDNNSDTPIVFNSIGNTNVYVDNYATAIRTKGWGRNATKMIIIFSYSWGDFCNEWPEFAKKASIGKIPRGLDIKDISRTMEQNVSLEDEIEVAYGYDIVNKNFTIFAGSACTVMEEYNGDEYPFIIKEKAYIPVSQLICMPSSEGFYNHGIGSMIYKLAIISRRLMNMELSHIEDNTYPIELISLPQGQAASFFNKLQTAHKMRAAGKKGYVPIERDPSDPNGAAISSQTLVTQNLFNEWQAIYDRLDKEIRRLGINIDELETTSGTTATEIRALDENSSAFVKQVMEYNASESKFLVELTIDFITQFVSKKNKSPLNLMTMIEGEDAQKGIVARADGMTLGDLAQELKDNNYFVVIDSRTGAIPSHLMQITNYEQQMARMDPMSPAFAKLNIGLAHLQGIDLSESDFGIQQQTAPGMPGEAPPPGATPTGTDRLNIQQMSSVPIAA